MSNASYKYKVGNMQGLLQILVYLVSRGYTYYCIVNLPIKKRDRWDSIDQKLIKKYGADKNKWQRHRAKAHKKANFYYLRLNDLALILHTNGSVDHIENYDDKFSNIQIKPMVFAVTPLTSYEINISKEQKVCVKLSQPTYNGLESKFRDIVQNKDVVQIKKEFDIINGYPAWAGVIQQKRRLARFVSKLAAKHQMDLKIEDLRIHTRRKIHPVWQDEEAQ